MQVERRSSAAPRDPSNLVWRGNWVHHNIGNGLWMDYNVRNVTFEDNLIEDNTAIGIFYEVSWDGIIRHNVVRNNAAKHAGKSCFWGAQIHVNDSQNVEIYGNLVRSTDGSNGICAVDIDRTATAPASTKVADLFVHDNVVRVRRSSMTGLVGRTAAYRHHSQQPIREQHVLRHHHLRASIGPGARIRSPGAPGATSGTTPLEAA